MKAEGPTDAPVDAIGERMRSGREASTPRSTEEVELQERC
jgi:hypothetical protein